MKTTEVITVDGGGPGISVVPEYRVVVSVMTVGVSIAEPAVEGGPPVDGPPVSGVAAVMVIT